MKGREMVAKILKTEGTDFVSHYPSVGRVIGDIADEGIRIITTRHERTAIAMADAYTRYSMGHKHGVAMTQANHASHNIMGGLGQAFDDLSPILMMPAGIAMNQLQKRTWDAAANYKGVTKWSAHLDFAVNIPTLMSMAYTRLKTGRPAPVLLEMMRDALEAEIQDSDFNYERVKGWKSQGDPHDVEVAVRALLNAKYPVLFAGEGVLKADAAEEFREFAELVQAPVATGLKGKSTFPEDHPLSVGIRGRANWMCMGRADLVFGIGASLSGRHSGRIPPGAKIVICNIGEYDVNMYRRANHVVIGDSKLVLRQLIEEVKKQTNGAGVKKNEELETEIAQEKALQLQEWLPIFTSNNKPINPYRVLWDMLHTFDRKNLAITHESGSPREQLGAIWEALLPRSFLGWGHTTNLGFSWGAAMAAKLMWPEKLSVNWVGDAAMGHNGMDMETAFREDLPILTVVSNNSGYAVYGPKGRSRLPPAIRMVSPSNAISYAAVAAGLGWYSERIEEPDEVIPALKRGIKEVNAGRPAMIEVITEWETARVSYTIPNGYQPGKL